MNSPAHRDHLQEARRHADQVHSRLVELGATMATAESLTGGMLGALPAEPEWRLDRDRVTSGGAPR